MVTFWGSCKMGKCVDVQVRLAFFQPSYSISIILFLDNVKTACESNEIHEGSTMCLLEHYMKNM